MKQVVVVCLGVLLSLTLAQGSVRPPEAFELAYHVGEPNARSFFLFSTSAGNYTIRQDGMGEVASRTGMRKVFNLKVGGKNRLERVYFLEHEGDLFLLYDLSGQHTYLLRMEQTKRKLRWFTPLPVTSDAATIAGDVVIVGESLEINKTDGRVVKQG